MILWKVNFSLIQQQQQQQREKNPNNHRSNILGMTAEDVNETFLLGSFIGRMRVNISVT